MAEERLPFIQIEVSELEHMMRGLNLSTRGFLITILNAMWLNGSSLPLNEGQLAKLTGLNRRQIKDSFPKISSLMDAVDDDSFTEKSLQKAYKRATEKREKNRRNGRVGGLKTARNRRNHVVSIKGEGSRAGSNHNHNHNYNSFSTQEEETRHPDIDANSDTQGAKHDCSQSTHSETGNTILKRALAGRSHPTLRAPHPQSEDRKAPPIINITSTTAGDDDV